MTLSVYFSCFRIWAKQSWVDTSCRLNHLPPNSCFLAPIAMVFVSVASGLHVNNHSSLCAELDYFLGSSIPTALGKFPLCELHNSSCSSSLLCLTVFSLDIRGSSTVFIPLLAPHWIFTIKK